MVPCPLKITIIGISQRWVKDDHISLVLAKTVMGLWGYYVHGGYTLIPLYDYHTNGTGESAALNQCLLCHHCFPSPLYEQSFPYAIYLTSLHLSNTNMARVMGNLKGSNPNFCLPCLSIWSGYQALPPFRPDLCINCSGQTGMPLPPPVESARCLCNSWAITTQDLSSTCSQWRSRAQAWKVDWITMYLRTWRLSQRSTTLVRCSSNSAGVNRRNKGEA